MLTTCLRTRILSLNVCICPFLLLSHCLQDDPEPGRANIYFSVIINSSKERMAFSDFPPPAEFPNNMHHSEMLQYLRLYAKAFKLLQHIHFQVSAQYKYVLKYMCYSLGAASSKA